MNLLVKGVSWPYSWFERWLRIGGDDWIAFNEGGVLGKWLPVVLVVRRHLFYFAVCRPVIIRLVWGKDVKLKGAKGLSVNGRNVVTGEQW